MRRNLIIDLFKVVLACMVVAIHGINPIEISGIAYDMSINSIFRIAVPLFVLVSGYYFFYTIDNNTGWFKRVFILYVFWQVVYSHLWLENEYSMLGFMGLIFIGYYHLWYLPAMMFAAALLVILRRVNTIVMLCMIVLLFSVGLSIQYGFVYKLSGLEEYHYLIEKYSLLLSRNFLFFIFPFFCLGFLINKERWVEKVGNINLKPYIYALLIGLIMESFWFSFGKQQVNRDLLFFLLPLCPLIFLQLLKMKAPCDWPSLSVVSSSIYFFHIMLLDFLGSFLSISSVFLVVFTCILASSLGGGVILLKYRFKYFKYVF
ncbi:acyltransferase family protein [Vibrio sp. MarTm2]|uniref:acyltransferase family protein n=1 Tax=Vibrio sp. MarTm2 TaxID=2998831 RepID=UPI0022CD7C1C|nr:acyltransferase family protein [Vibrio sp. MarTm2]MDA0130016.1 acyltransferase family protein [Vibrio sp. MarTm2]